MKQERKRFLIRSAVSMVVFPVVWLLLDLLYCSLITRGPFTFSFTDHVLKPVAFALIYDSVEESQKSPFHSPKMSQFKGSFGNDVGLFLKKGTFLNLIIYSILTWGIRRTRGR